MIRSFRIGGLGLRLLFAFFFINGIAAFFVLRIFTAEIKPNAREVMEEMLVDTANILAELAAQDFPSDSPDLAQVQSSRPGAMQAASIFNNRRFAQSVDAYVRRSVDAKIWGLNKTSLDYRIYVTDARGIVQYDSAQQAEGQDYSNWRDVYLTLRGQYGARSSSEDAFSNSTVMHVAAPIYQNGHIVGVLTVAKPNNTVAAFITRSENKIMQSGLLLLALSAAVGILVTIWMVWNVRKLRSYANNVQGDDLDKISVPMVPGELGELARAMDAMRKRLEGRAYIEHYVRSLTHELKSPVAAIRGAAELLEDELPESDRQRFAIQINQQAARIQQLIDKLLQLNRLEQQQVLQRRAPALLSDCVYQAMRAMQAVAEQRSITLELRGRSTHALMLDADLVILACTNLLANALDFSASNSSIQVDVNDQCIVVRDYGLGVPDYAISRLGERFFTTSRPDGKRSGSGLGLAIVMQIMALHGGHVIFEQAHPGLQVTLNFLPAFHG